MHEGSSNVLNDQCQATAFDARLIVAIDDDVVASQMLATSLRLNGSSPISFICWRLVHLSCLASRTERILRHMRQQVMDTLGLLP